MDIQATINDLVSKIKNESGLLDKFKADPLGTVKSLLGKGIADDVLAKIVDGVKAKIGIDQVSGVASKLGKLFGK